MLGNNRKKKTLPNFLGIGAMRSGTTWLDEVLRSHPDIYLPQRRKEIHFFDLYYEKGIEWYQDFFPSGEQEKKYQQIGEITPAYLYFPEISSRIKNYLPDCRFLIILRNPVHRAYSHYGFLIKNFAESRDFVDVLEANQELIEKGMYFKQIQRYLQHYPQENFLFLIFEEVTQNPQVAFKQLANFLSVDFQKFDLSTISTKKNTSEVVRFSKARALACNSRDFLRQRDLDWIWNMAKSSGLNRVFETAGKPIPPMKPETKLMLSQHYSSDIKKLATLLDKDLSIWNV